MFQALRYRTISGRRVGHARRVIMANDNGGGVQFQSTAHYFTRVDFSAVNRAVEHFLESQRPVASVEK